MQDRLTYYDLPLSGAQVRYYPNWLKAKHASDLFQHFVKQLEWQQPTIRLYGKEHLIPRLQAWYGDPNAQYEYSKMLLKPLDWEPRLFRLKEACEQVAKVEFNSVLANYYRNGQDSMGMHADDEPSLGLEPTIASVSLGQARRFTFKHKETGESHKIQLDHGSLLIMRADTQQNWLHGINKSRTQRDARLNFTFRWIFN